MQRKAACLGCNIVLYMHWATERQSITHVVEEN